MNPITTDDVRITSSSKLARKLAQTTVLYRIRIRIIQEEEKKRFSTDSYVDCTGAHPLYAALCNLVHWSGEIRTSLS